MAAEDHIMTTAARLAVARLLSRFGVYFARLQERRFSYLFQQQSNEAISFQIKVVRKRK